MIKKISKVIRWAKGRKKVDAPKFTWWSSSKDSCRLGGFTITNLGQYNESEVDGSVQCVAHSSDGECYWKHFDIPLDKVDEFCQAIKEVRDFAVQNPHSNNT
tara:strand:+ start:1102 stop:1407 length:306 start_codon:yes stop_codon:yes gene_type:complete